MGTKFRTLLAPIGMGTGDGRRFADGAISLAATPFPLEWARSREGGHDGAVTVGAVQEAAVLSVGEALRDGWISPEAAAGMDPASLAVWGRGELFDGIDRGAMPRLAEDVAEAAALMGAGTLGPSVDLDSFEGVPVQFGTETRVTPEQMDAHFALTGEEMKLELLITSGRVRAATLVSIPAFAETSRPLELIVEDALIAAEGRTINTHCVNCGDTRGGPVGHEISECTWDSNVVSLALIASVGVDARPSIVAFSGALEGPTPITYDYESGRVFGHIATWRTCHVGYSDVCVTAPKSADEYASFNRFPVETDEGVVWAGRITAGGRHAALSATAAGAIAEHDGKTVVGYVRAYEDEFGIAVAGVIEPDLDEGTRAVLSRRKVSGDWRETAAGLSLVEVLALAPGPRAHSEPGFPVETFSRAGRQVALVASLSPEVETLVETPGETGFSLSEEQVTALAVKAVEEMERRRHATLARKELAAAVTADARASLAAVLNGGQ